MTKYDFTVTHKVQVPLIDKRNAQVVSLQGDEAQLMDMESYEMFNIAIPDDIKDKIEAGQEVQYQEAMGRRMITRA